MITIELYGPTTVRTESDLTLSAGDLGGNKPRQILELLAVHTGTPVPKERLADLLWQGTPPRSYLATLESYVCVLRRSLGLGVGRRTALATTSHGYLLDAEQVQVDVAEVRRLLERAASAPPAASVDLTHRALALVRGPLLASEPYADWATEERGCVDRAVVAACTRAAGHAISLGRPEDAAWLAAAAVEREPLAERAVQQLMRGLWRSGQRFEAFRAYADLRSMMVDELGMDPDRETHALYLEILRDDAGATPSGGPTELRLILGLLRQTLESIPGIELGSDDSLAAAAVRALQVA